jgi:pimeloyl-ACP methyl ester carboxylesterase
MSRLLLLLLLLLLLPVQARAATRDVYDRVRDGYADNNGVRIHYATLGRTGPLIVMIHGFPDFWYTWRDQMAALSRHYQVVAMDQRGYNLSDKPQGVKSYDILLLASDVAAVIHDVGRDKAVVVGHDWGGEVAWVFAAIYPDMVERLVVLNAPHPRGLFRELREDPAQQAASAYARVFQQDGSERSLSPEGLAAWVRDPAARERYIEAFRRSDFTAMLDYYRQNYPRAPYTDLPLPIVKAPVLIVYGLADNYLLPATLNGTWQWLEQSLTLVTVPGVGHFVQQDASAVVTRAIKTWLADDRPPR